MPADLDALAAALLEKETVDEPETRQATGLSPTPRRENCRSLIAAVASGIRVTVPCAEAPPLTF
jgi:hypothetical protein